MEAYLILKRFWYSRIMLIYFQFNDALLGLKMLFSCKYKLCTSIFSKNDANDELENKSNGTHASRGIEAIILVTSSRLLP